MPPQTVSRASYMLPLNLVQLRQEYWDLQRDIERLEEEFDLLFEYCEDLAPRDGVLRAKIQRQIDREVRGQEISVPILIPNNCLDFARAYRAYYLHYYSQAHVLETFEEMRQKLRQGLFELIVGE